MGRAILDLKRQANSKFQQMQQSIVWQQKESEFKLKRLEMLN